MVFLGIHDDLRKQDCQILPQKHSPTLSMTHLHTWPWGWYPLFISLALKLKADLFWFILIIYNNYECFEKINSWPRKEEMLDDKSNESCANICKTTVSDLNCPHDRAIGNHNLPFEALESREIEAALKRIKPPSSWGQIIILKEIQKQATKVQEPR